MTAKLLQLANSAFLGFSRTTLSIEETIKRLGVLNLRDY
ncbi:HDOD domain-containing protein [Shewanella putrefaciens]